MNTAEQIKEYWERVRALAEAADALAQAGLTDEALAAAERIEDPEKRVWALSETAIKTTLKLFQNPADSAVDGGSFSLRYGMEKKSRGASRRGGRSVTQSPPYPNRFTTKIATTGLSSTPSVPAMLNSIRANGSFSGLETYPTPPLP